MGGALLYTNNADGSRHIELLESLRGHTSLTIADRDVTLLSSPNGVVLSMEVPEQDAKRVAELHIL